MFIAIANYENSHGGAASSLCEMLNMVQANVTVIDGSKQCDVVSKIKLGIVFKQTV